MTLVKVEPEVIRQPVRIKNEGTLGWFKQALHRSRNEIFSEVKTVTPQLAEIILQNNPDNRSIRASKFMQLVSDMRNGRWTMNGEPVIIAKTGELNDGQHRLKAVVEAGVSVPILFVFGVERDTRTTVDQGANRSASDYLGMTGVVNASVTAAIARMLISYERANRTMLGSTNRVTAAEVLERVKTDITIGASAVYANRYARLMHHICAGSVIGFCHNILLSKNVTEGLAFMEQLCRGEGLTREDPAFRAREKLINIGKSSTATKVEIILRAWNAYRQKRTMATIPVHGRLPELA